MTNSFNFNQLPYNFQLELKNLHQEAMQSGNPREFVNKKFGNDPIFQEGMQILNTQGIESFRSYLVNHFNKLR